MTSLTMPALLTFVAVLVICRKTTAAAYTPPELSRRKAVDLAFRHASIGASFLLPIPTFAADFDTDARLELPIETIKGKSYSISIPRVGYSLYKTSAEEVPLCMELALQAGVQHFDVASFYGTNEQVGDVLKSFVQKGLELVPDPAPSKSERRKRLFVTHKVSNTEQSGNKAKVKKAVKDQLKKLNIGYLDMCMVHSPLTDKGKRLATYEALLDLQSEGVVRAVGTCNYGVNPLNEIVDAGFPAPTVNQLVLNPFNQHKDVIEWAKQHGTTISCNAWSKLSSAQGPQEGWAVVADIAKNKGLTKAQVLVRWAFQKGYLSVPRSGSKSKIERIAIQENSYNGVKDVVLTEKEMDILDGLDEKLPAGRLGILDGWTESDIVGESWDPTLAV